MRIITYGTEFDNNMRLKLVQEKCIYLWERKCSGFTKENSAGHE